MSNYRRNYVPGGTYFFTVVTHLRRRFLTDELARDCLRKAFQEIRAKWPFEIVAFVLLPDHLHTVLTLPSGDSQYPLRWRRIKEEFTRSYLRCGGQELPQSRSRIDRGQRGIWQRRYWEHTCRDEDDLKRSVDYLHWNPKKHGLVKNVVDWPWSSFHRYVRLGEYPSDWGREDPTPGYDSPEWDESALEQSSSRCAVVPWQSKATKPRR
jgi:putative transposase